MLPALRSTVRSPRLRSLVLLLLALVLAPPASAQDSLEDLAREARTGKDFRRARAVRSLAELDTHGAWEVLLELLGDPSGEAGGSAGWYLGTTRDADVVARLAGPEGLGSRDEVVRRRAAEALGRSPVAVEHEALWTVATRDKSPAARRLAWRALELRAVAGEDALGDEKDAKKRRAALEKAARKEKVVEVRARALAAAAVLLRPDDARPWLVEALADRVPGVRAAAVTALAATPGPVGPWEAAVDDEHWAVRRAVLEAWGRAPSTQNVRRLVARLEVEPRARLVARVVALLRELSGLRHGADARPWRDWADALPDDWTPGAKPKAVDPLEVSSSWNGFPLLSGHVALLIDLSGSIREEREDGRTRKDVVDEELAAALESLDESVRFVLVGYHRDVLAWKDEPVPATPKNVAAALKWFRDVDSSGPGNLWAAIEHAWGLGDELDTLFVLHDGAPTGDVLYRAELYRELFLERNLARQTFFDTMLVDSSRFVRERFTELAERSGGIATARDLDGGEDR